MPSYVIVTLAAAPQQSKQPTTASPSFSCAVSGATTSIRLECTATPRVPTYASDLRHAFNHLALVSGAAAASRWMTAADWSVVAAPRWMKVADLSVVAA